jgi:hypothetical protein
MGHLRRAVARMLRPTRDDLLLAHLAPDIVAVRDGACQVICLIELLPIVEARATAPVRRREKRSQP